MSETELTPEQQMQAIMEQLQNSIDPRDFMTPSQREIADLAIEDLEAEYLLVSDKKSSRSRNQRDYIVSRYEFEQSKLKDETNENDTSNTTGDSAGDKA